MLALISILNHLILLTKSQGRMLIIGMECIVAEINYDLQKERNP